MLALPVDVATPEFEKRGALPAVNSPTAALTPGQNKASEEDASQLEEKLLQLCSEGSFLDARRLINAGANVDAEDRNSWTPLIWAAFHGDFETAELLISKGAMSRYNLHEKATTDEAKRPSTRLSLTFLRRFNTFRLKQDTDQPAPSAIRSMRSRTSVPSVLSDEQGSDMIAKKESNEAAPLYLKSPLHWAAYNGNLKIVSLLLKHGFSPNAKDAMGNTALHQAVCGGSLEVTECLLSQGFDLEQKNNRKHTVIDYAKSQDILDILKRARDTKVCEIDGTVFSSSNWRFMCSWTKRFYSKQSVSRKFVASDSNDTKKMKPVAWNIRLQENLSKIENELIEAARQENLEGLRRLFSSSTDQPVDPELLEKCRGLEAKLSNRATVKRLVAMLTLRNEVLWNSNGVRLLEEAINKAKELGSSEFDFEKIERLKGETQAKINLQNCLRKINFSSLQWATEHKEMLAAAYTAVTDWTDCNELRTYALLAEKRLETLSKLRSALTQTGKFEDVETLLLSDSSGKEFPIEQQMKGLGVLIMQGEEIGLSSQLLAIPRKRYQRLNTNYQRLLQSKRRKKPVKKDGETRRAAPTSLKR